MEQMQNFMKGVKSQTRMLSDASAGGTIRSMTEPQVKDLIEKMCLSEYHSKSERSVKIETVGTSKYMLVVDTYTILLAYIELLNQRLVERSLGKVRDMKMEYALWKDPLKRINFIISR